MVSISSRKTRANMPLITQQQQERFGKCQGRTAGFAILPGDERTATVNNPSNHAHPQQGCHMYKTARLRVCICIPGRVGDAALEQDTSIHSRKHIAQQHGGTERNMDRQRNHHATRKPAAVQQPYICCRSRTHRYHALRPAATNTQRPNTRPRR